MHDILLINANFSQTENNNRMCLPLGILYLGAVLEKEGYRTYLQDYNLNPKSYMDIVKDLKKWPAPIILISSLSTGYSFVKELVKLIRKTLPEAKIILGGAITYGIPEIILENTEVDFVVEGEAEKLIVDLISRMADNKNLHPQIVRAGSENFVTDLDSIPFPAWHLANVECYISRSLHAWHSQKMRTFPILTSRGCPYSCNFCTKPLGSKMRQRRKSKVAEEIELAANSFKVNDIWFIDEEFALSEERVTDLCSAVSGVKRGLSFACSMRVDIVNKDILKQMKKAGCRRIIYGVESGSQKILDKMGKGFTLSNAARAIQETREMGIEAFVNFMFGYPGETESSIQETYEFMKKHRLYSGFGFTMPLPGTKLFNDSIETGKIKDIDTYLEDIYKCEFKSKFLINLTDLSNSRLIELRQEIQHKLFPNRVVLHE